MAKEPLRSYNHQIEKLIDQGQFEEALAHCRYILQAYPKHLETYRLLGKAYLESQRYGEAADIFTRILASIPDDFVANIGMSIVREDEGNLDSAIWHMERAFEVQPANTAVQDELRRLYGRRDGLEPARVRLTRGALVRMYVRGDLYHQAIAEARAALLEDPQRPDLQLLLARMCYQAGQRVEATEICSNLLTKYPYCYEANRILAEILPETKRAEDAQIYRLRMNALDPYAAFISKETPDPDRIPDNAITLDRLEWLPSTQPTERPQWASTLGIEDISRVEENRKVPEWYNEQAAPPNEKGIVPAAEKSDSSTATLKPPEPEIQETINQLEKNSQLPDWMTSAGWVQSTGAVEEKPAVEPEVESNQPDNPEPIDELQMAQIPDWLKDLAPKDSSLDAAAPVEDLNAFESLFTKTEEPNPKIEEAPQVLPSSPETTASAAPSEDLTAALSQPSVPEPPTTTVENEDAAMAWLESLAAKQGADEETLFVKPEERTETPPAWITESIDKTNIEEPALPTEAPLPVDEAPDGLKDLARDQAEFITEPQVSQAPAAQETMVNFEEAAGEPAAEALIQAPEESTVEPVADMTASSDDQDAAFAWLESLAAKHGAEEETLLNKPADRMETPPEWINEAAAQPPIEINEANPVVETVEQSPLPENQQEVLAPEGAEQPKPSEIAGDHPQEIQEPQQPVAAAPVQPHEDQMYTAILPEINEPPAPVEAGTAQSPVDAESQDAAFAWLETLAARQGADEETLLVTPEDRTETPPAWVQETSEVTPQEISEANKPESTVEAGSSNVSDWLQGLETTETPQAPQVQSPDQANPSDLSWLHELEKSTQQASESLTQPVSSEPAAEVMPPANIPTTTPEPQAAPVELQPAAPEIKSELFVLTLKQAQSDFSEGNLTNAVQEYTQLINAGQYLDETIHDLRDGLYKYPMEISLLQTLGDAYVRANRLQDALDIYTQAEDLIR